MPVTNRYHKVYRKKVKKTGVSSPPEDPPICLWSLWLLICFGFFQPQCIAFAVPWINFFGKYILSACILIDALALFRSWFRRFARPILHPQGGFTDVDPFMKEALQVWCLFESLRDAKTKRGMIAAIVQYMQAHVKESLPMYLYRQIMRINYISDWTSDDGHSQIESMLEEAFGAEAIRETEDGLTILDPNGGDELEVPWHEAMDQAFTNWKTFRASSMAKRFTHLINVIVSSGMCATADLTFTMGNVTLFSPIVSKKQLGAGDVFEAFYEAVSGFMKGGWRVFETGEVSAFFMEDDKVSEFDTMYNEIRSWHGYAISGNLQEYTDIDDNEYEARLKKAIEFGDNLLKFIKRSQTFERKYISDRMDRLRDNDTEFTQMRTRGGLRVAPFAVCLFGQSGCGKSSLTNLSVKAGLKYNGLCADDNRIATWADNDKYASAIRSFINAIIFDDFANTKEDFMDFSPAYRLIQVINNIRYLAPMADVFLKGKVSLNPYFCFVSTNVEHLNAAMYSNEPESVLRRLYHVKVEPKPECCVDGILNKEKVEQHYGKTACPDAWFLTIRVYTALNCRHIKMDAFKPITFEGKPMIRVSVKEYLRWLQITSKKHFADEKTYLANQQEDPEECPECGTYYCDCASHDAKKDGEDEQEMPPLSCPKPKPDVGEWKYYSNVDHEEEMICQPCSEPEVQASEWDYYSSPNKKQKQNPVLIPNAGEWEEYSGRAKGFFDQKAEVIQGYYAKAKANTIIAADNLCARWERVDFMPERYICHPRVLQFCLVFWKEDIKQSLISGLSGIFFAMLVACYAAPSLSLLWIPVSTFGMYWYVCATMQTYRHMIRNRILELKDVVKTYTQTWQFKYSIIGLGAIALILATMKSRYAKLEAQTGLSPESMEEVNARNDAVNPWLLAETVPLPMSEPSKTTTSDDLARSMKTNLVGIVSDMNKTTLGFYIVSNFLLVPTHFLKVHGDRDVGIRCYKNGMDKVGSFFRDKISCAYRVDIPLTDFSLCFVTGGGSMKDFRKFLPEGNVLKRSPAKVVTREIMDTALQVIPMLFRGTSRVAHTETTFMGSYYDLPIDTKNGMCMSPVISDTRGSMIMGFHLGGKGKIGGCGTLTLDQVNFALSELASVDGVVLSASCGDLIPNMGDFPTETFGKQILEAPEIHPKSAVNFLTGGACIDIYGKTSGKATPHSNVAPTIMSDAVEEVFEVPQKWGPPKMKGKGRYPYQATLVHAALPSLPIGSVLAKSVRSIKDLTTDLKQRIPELFEAKPLSRVATVSGLIGVKFIDAMNFSTSPGFPLTGNKHPLLVDLDPEDYPDVGKPRTFVPEVWAEFEKIVDVLKEGKRCYMIWKSCLKDEPTKLTKDKVRVFQSAPLVLQLLVRMYFLPIIRIIQMNPILYECAVGVNSEGLEWEELWEAAMSKGKDRVLAGDYSKYDVRMPAQVTIAAFDILIDIAEKCDGYTEDDIHLMKMMVHEIVYPVLAYNGELIQLFGTNPSGQNLTVIINSLVNSLLLRCCFFTIYPDKDFKKHCSFLTYGDDVIGTVSIECGDFTHITYAAWLAEHDMKFTMPDKESDPVHYMSEKDVDFLKRSCVFNEDLGRKVGLLSEDSIFKRLHSHILSKELTLQMHSAQNIESSLHDWFYYGRDVFEDRREKLRAVAQKCDIEHLCPALDVSYDKRVNRWRHKYLGEDLEEDEYEEFILDPHCGDLFVGTYDYFDHCVGTWKDPYFWWEHKVADFSLLFLHPFLWYLLSKGYTFKVGIPSFQWILVLTFLTGGFAHWQAIILLIVRTLVALYVPYFLGKLYYEKVVLELL